MHSSLALPLVTWYSLSDL